MKKLSSELMTLEVIERIISAIKENESQEIAFSGTLNEEGLVSAVEILSYGNDSAAAVDLLSALHGDVLIHNHPSSNLHASEADIELAGFLANQQLGFYIIDNQCNFVNVIHPPHPKILLKDQEIVCIFQEDGLLSKNISGYEVREEQMELVQKITQTINQNGVLISEAGTGTGKSLSYLIPTAIWAVQNGKRVMITTYTINLQQQIAGKDMSIVNRIVESYTGKSVPYAVLVGKQNYLCKKRLYDLFKDPDRQNNLFNENQDLILLEKIEQWNRNAQEGTRSEFPDVVPQDLWEEIATDSMHCTRKNCPYYSDCFYFKARAQAEASNLIIANHSLLLASVNEETLQSTLPAFSGVVFDEAHHLEDVALKSTSKEFSVRGLLYQIRKLFSSKAKSKGIGMLPLCLKKANISNHPQLTEEYHVLIQNIRELISEINEFFSTGMEILKTANSDSFSLTIDENFMQSDSFDWLDQRLDSIFNTIVRISNLFDGWSEKLKKVSTKSNLPEILQSVRYRIDNLLKFHEIYERIFHFPDEIGIVRWIEQSPRNLKFSWSPIEVEDFLVNTFFSKKDFTIFTSATLMINKKFSYFKNSIGLALLSNKNIIETSMNSPFNYQEQAELYILKEDLSYNETSKEKTNLIRDLIFASEGGALVLFTSYKRLIQTFNALHDTLMENGILPVRQGEKSREELLNLMQTRPYAALFATSSFWEGIDVQGENLRCVIIEKIPFESPSDPIYKAKVHLIKSRGKEPFITYAIPRAVLRLKQGIGRLIRSKNDRGMIAILDNRLKTKKYGKIFLDSFPPLPVFYESGEDLIREAHSFFSHQNFIIRK